MPVPTEDQLLRSLIRILGADESTPSERRAHQFRMCEEIEAVRGDFSIPDGVFERTSVYLGPRRPFLFHILARVFRSDRDPQITRDEAVRLRSAYSIAEPIYADLPLVTAVILREHDSGLLGGAGRIADSYAEGGLDYLGREMRRMTFLPAEVGRAWRAVPAYTACEGLDDDDSDYCRRVHPASIPRSHEIVAYASMLRLRESVFRERVTEVFGEEAPEMLANMTVRERRAWTQLTFARQGGFEFRPARRVSAAGIAAEAEQFERRRAGLITLLTAMKETSDGDRYPASLSAILTNPGFSHMPSVRIARVRAAEAEVLERLGFLPRAGVQTH